MRITVIPLICGALAVPCGAKELHVSAGGALKTISAAAQQAEAGDVITVHAGVYRERVTPPRGGESDLRRIVYQAAPGEKVEIKGSEVVRGWKLFLPGVWKATLPQSFFGAYNPYRDLINGDWFQDKGRPHHTGQVFLNGRALWETHLMERVVNPPAEGGHGESWTWFTESDERNTYLYANFHDRDPNRELVEISVRESCFYPDQPGRNYITVRGFHMSQAATQWAAPTAEQIALIGTHWSKGWIIENNVISESRCSGISLGKDRKTGHNVWNLDPRKDGATHYNEVILRALAGGWSRETIGSHTVRGNTIFNCEQAGIVGSLGAVFSRISNNHIYDIWARRQFTGAEMAGIKLHGAIDVTIEGNRVHHTGRGLWMDWMAQGTRISGNVLYDNDSEDLFMEVNHGPFLVDNNVMLSPLALRDVSEGGAYVHNLMGGRILARPEPRRSTPFHKPHSTALAGLDSTLGGDDRFYNNLFAGGEGRGLWVYNHSVYPLRAAGNVYGAGARAYFQEEGAATGQVTAELAEQDGHGYLVLDVDAAAAGTRPVTTALLGKAKTSGTGYESPDGRPLTIDRDYAGRSRSTEAPTPGPFEGVGKGKTRLKLW